MTEEEFQQIRERWKNAPVWVQAWDSSNGAHIEEMATRRVVAHHLMTADVEAIIESRLDALALVAEVERLRAENADLREMLTEIVAAADATYVETHPYAGVGHTRVVGPFPETLTKARAILAAESEGDVNG